MKKADIRKILDSDPRTPFAVRVPRFQYGRKVGTDTVKALIEHVYPDLPRVRIVTADPLRREDVYTIAVLSTIAVIDTWDAWKLNQDWDVAIRENQRRDDMAAYDRERAERAAAIEALLPAFEGIMVPADSMSSANYDRSDENLADALRQTFVTGGAAGAMFGWESFAAIARRIEALKLTARQQPPFAMCGGCNGIGTIDTEDWFVTCSRCNGDGWVRLVVGLGGQHA